MAGELAAQRKETTTEEEKKKSSSSSSSKGFLSSPAWTVFAQADAVDGWLMALGCFGAIGDGFSMPLMLVITSKLMNDIGNGPLSDSHFFPKIVKNTVDLLYLAAGIWVAANLEGYCWSRTGERQASRMRARYLKAVLRQDVEYFDLRPAATSEAITSVSSDTLVIQDTIGEKVPNFLMNMSTFVGSYLAAFVLTWKLAVVAFPTVLLLIIPGLMYGRILMDLARKIREEYSKAGSIVEQAVSSIRTVYSFAGEHKTMVAFSAALQESVRLGVRQGLTKGVAIGSNGVTFAIWAFMVWYGSRLVMYHGVKGGTVFAAGAAVIIGGLSLGSGLSNVKYFSEASSAAERIMEVVRRVPNIDPESTEGEVLADVRGEVEFRGVEFAYPSRPEIPIFAGLNLLVPSARTVALVGGSGSGKSTAIALLERFYDPTAGKVLLDGMDIKGLNLRWLRSQMGLVSQEPALFATSIRANILFGKEDASMEEVVAAATAANAHSFISQLPQGYDTKVGERGVQMSGGQKQRIAIARAIVRSPKILLLDEATSALDSESERVVQEALDAASVGRTTIVVAHRLSTIRNADTIAVLQSGDVVEAGSHDELIRLEGGVYNTLVRIQESNTNANPDEIATTTAAAALAYSSSRQDRISSGRSMSRRFAAAASRSSSGRSNDVINSSGAATNIDPAGANSSTLYDPSNLPAPSFRRLLMLNSPEWKQAALGCFGATIFGGIQPVYAFAMGGTVAMYFLTDHHEIKTKTRGYALLFAGLAALSLCINMLQHYNFGVMGERLTLRVRERMLSKMLIFEVGWFDQDQNSTGAICSRLAKDAGVVRSLVGDRIALMVQTVSAVAVACTMGLIIAWRLAIVMIAIQPIIILSFYSRRSLLKNMSEKAVSAQEGCGKIAAEAVSNLRTVTAFCSQDRILHLLDTAEEAPRRESVRQSWYAGLGLATSQGIMACTWALDFWYGGKLVSQGRITSKALFQTFMVLLSTGRIIADAGSMTTDIAKGANAVASVFAVLDRYTRIDPEDEDGHRPEKLEGRVDIQGVDFAYPARPDVPILSNFSLAIEAGRSIALVGHSGSGKSTIISLIERFYDPAKGAVMIDGREIRAYHLRSLRQHIAIVGQEPTLFSGTILENITYGAAEGVTESEVEAAARVANAHDFIAGLKEGYRTWCGDRGVQLSGGQKQRIAIARAVLKNPAILLLDEATSALDSQSEKLVQEALERVMVGRTSVVVAHRLNTIRNCDLIAVLNKGTVVEKGSHQSLLSKGPTGSYFGLVSIQQAGSKDPR